MSTEKTRRQMLRYQTQWTAQFYVAAELTRRGYLVSLTFGNAPVADLIVQSPKGKTFTIDVKGQSTRNFWLVRRCKESLNHFFVLVYLPLGLKQPQFFILLCSRMMQHRHEYEVASKKRGKYHDNLGGMNWSTAMPHQDKWKVLPS